jgi:hypothetical protein
MRRTLTIIDDGRQAEAEVEADGESLRLSPAALRTALGFELKPEGLCKDQLCVPLRDRPGGAQLVTADGVDLSELAALLDRPLALDREEGAAYVGVSSEARSTQLDSLDAPDFRLPDLDGKLHALSDYRGRKVFLLAWASW